jgi:pyridoxal phosphate enzyme (YggS family)
MTMIHNRLKHILAQIRQAEIAYQRKPGSVLLLAVSKTKPARDIAEAYQAGQRHFGESYCQEALKKQQELGAFDITWHFIGPIQSNKTRTLATHFDWVHSVDSFKIAKRLSEQRPNALPPLNICLQINISGEPSKSGISLDELPQLCEQVAVLPNLMLRGVMAIPQPEEDFELQRLPYKTLYQAVANSGNLELDTCSFGMSGDLVAAIAEGSTIVRIGTALFGERV